MQLTVDRLFATPDYHFLAFDGSHAVFVRMDRAAYRRSIFLDGRVQPADPAPLRVDAAALLRWQDQATVPVQPSGWIFHVANCGSTLLARALDHADGNLVLREPSPLRQLGVAAQASRAGAWPAQLRLAATMAGRRYRPALPTIVKANVPVNFILDDLLAAAPAAPAILLYYPLREYLLAFLRSDAHRQWVTRVTDELAGAIASLAAPVAGLSAARRAAALWLAQIRVYDAAMRRFANVASLDADSLLNAPRDAIPAAHRHFGMALDDAGRDALLAGPLLATYSKNPGVAFDNAARLERQAAVAATVGDEIADARRWLDGIIGQAPLPDRLARPLTGDAPMLLA